MLFHQVNKPDRDSWVIRLWAFSGICMVFPGSFLLFLPVGSLWRAAAEASVWLGVLGCLISGLSWVFIRLWRFLWPK